jgi:hypothetical protein
MLLEIEGLSAKNAYFAFFVFRDYVYVAHVFSRCLANYFIIVVERVYITRL